MVPHAEARNLAANALRARFGVEPTSGEVKALAGIGWLETNYGEGWKGDGKGSFNIGAIHRGGNWQGETFLQTDTRPDSSGNSVEYVAEFRKYASPVDGWADLATNAFVANDRARVRAAAANDDWYGVSQGLYQTGYYEGFGATPEERIGHHYDALRAAIAKADGTNADDGSSIRVTDPQGTIIGTATVSDAVAPGFTPLYEQFGAPVLIAYPNGWRFLQFVGGIQIPVKTWHPYEPIPKAKLPQSDRWTGGFVLGIGLFAIVACLQFSRKVVTHASR